jgi:hypothetical protein
MSPEIQFRVKVRVACSSVDKAPPPAGLGGGGKSYLENTEIFCVFLWLDVVLLIEGSIVYPCHEIWEQLR